jgi:fructokinase
VLAKCFRFYWHQEGVLINETRDYHRYLGGSTNVAMNSTRLGNATMVAAVGDDGFGSYISRNSDVGVNTSHIKTLDNKSTSVIFVSRSEGTPDFIPFRAADCCIYEEISTKYYLKLKYFIPPVLH